MRLLYLSHLSTNYFFPVTTDIVFMFVFSFFSCVLPWQAYLRKKKGRERKEIWLGTGQTEGLFAVTGFLKCNTLSAETIGKLFSRWWRIKCCTLSNERSFVLTMPLGSTSNKCWHSPPCLPVRTNWPGEPIDSRTKKSPSFSTSDSLSFLLMVPWNQVWVLIDSDSLPRSLCLESSCRVELKGSKRKRERKKRKLH